MNVPAAAESRFELSGGALCLDFANTLDDRNEPQPDERLASYADLIDFSLEAGSITADEGRALAARVNSDGDHAAATLDDARALREVIYGVFSAVADAREPAYDDLATLNRWLARAHQHGEVVVDGDRFGWAWASDAETGTIDLERPLWPVARSAMELLLGGDLTRLRECAANDCGWLFLDTTRNRSRRWCSMQTCGNRAKVQGFRERQREGKADGEHGS